MLRGPPAEKGQDFSPVKKGSKDFFVLFRQHLNRIKGAKENVVIEKVVLVRQAGFFPWVKIDVDVPNRTTGSEKRDCVF